MTYKLVIFDLDYTLLYAGKLYCEVLDILKFLKTKDVLIALASYNPNAEYELRRHGIKDFFQHILYEDWNSSDNLDWKYRMLSDILSLTEIPSNETVFFDDYKPNLDTAKRLGITAVEVTDGVSMELIKETLQSQQLQTMDQPEISSLNL